LHLVICDQGYTEYTFRYRVARYSIVYTMTHSYLSSISIHLVSIIINNLQAYKKGQTIYKNVYQITYIIWHLVLGQCVTIFLFKRHFYLTNINILQVILIISIITNSVYFYAAEHYPLPTFLIIYLSFISECIM